MTTETTEPRTLEDVLDEVERIEDESRDIGHVDSEEVRSLIREAYALGAASRASPEEGRALPMPPPLTCRHNGPGAQRVTIFRECQCGDCSQVDVTDLALRSPPAPSEETRERCPKCSAFAMASVGGDAWRTCSRCHVSWTLEDRQSPAAPPPEDSGARAGASRKTATEDDACECGHQPYDHGESGCRVIRSSGEPCACRIRRVALERAAEMRAPASSKEGGRHE